MPTLICQSCGGEWPDNYCPACGHTIDRTLLVPPVIETPKETKRESPVIRDTDSIQDRRTNRCPHCNACPICGAITCAGVPINPAEHAIQCKGCAKWLEVGPDGYILGEMPVDPPTPPPPPQPPPEPMPTMSARHQQAAMSLHLSIIVTFGLLALACIGGGIYAIAANAKSNTDLDILGAHLSTGHVGVAFVGIGLIIALFSVRAVLKNQHARAALPPDYPVRRRKKK